MKEFFDFLDYDPLTGHFTWKKRSSSRASAGSIAGRMQSLGYRQIKLRGKTFYAHRLAWLFVTGAMPAHEIDHINGNRDDNRFANLRDIPRRLNVQNQHRTRKDSGLMGTWMDKRCGRWKSAVSTLGVVKRLSSFDTEAQANSAYLEEKRKQHEACVL